jgi:PKD repeat protein
MGWEDSMRSIPLMAATTVVLAAAWACGGDGGNVEPNNPPAAAFDAPTTCTVNNPCAFTDKSTDDHGITSRLWNFGDDHASATDNQSTDANPTHTYTEAKAYTVTLTVTDASGETNTATNTVTIGGGTGGNLPPTASFDLPTDCTAGTPCGFHSTSTDADGQIASANWDFGDGETGEGVDITHTFANAGTFTVTLTVTDDKGAPGTTTQQLTVAPAASQDCTTTGTTVDCSLGITSDSKVTITLVSRSCELAGNRLAVTAPQPQTVFFNICGRTPGETFTLKNSTGGDLVITAGSQLALRFFQGTADPGDPATGDPGIQVTGTFPTWTLKIDDGGAAGSPGEPDFNDAELTVQATTP